VIPSLSTEFRQPPSRRNLPSHATQSPTPPHPVLRSDQTYLWPAAHKRAPSIDTYRRGSRMACDAFVRIRWGVQHPVPGARVRRRTCFIHLGKCRQQPLVIWRLWPEEQWSDYFRSTSINGHRQTAPACLDGANTGSDAPHSITSSARARSVGGIWIPRDFAVQRLITSSVFVICRTGKSAGLSPFRTRAA
jgi:hypothetical protein